MTRYLLLAVALLIGPGARADLDSVLHWQSGQDLETVYKSLYDSLEDHGFRVVFEPDIGNSLKGFAGRWGEDYNRSRLSGIRAMVFCNGWYANQVSNLEPRLLALCPLHLTLYRQDETTHVVFMRPTFAGAGSAAETLLGELEADVRKAVEQGLASAPQGDEQLTNEAR